MQTTPEFLPHWLEGLTPEMVKRAERELGETPEVKRNALVQLRKLIDNEPGFLPVTDEGFLMRFLRVRKFNVQLAFQNLKNFYAFRLRYSGTLTDLSVLDLKPVLDQNTVIILPKRDRNGHGLLVIHVGAKDINVVTPEQTFAAVFLLLEIGMGTETSQVCGGRLVIDVTNLTFSKFVHYSTPSYLACLMRAVIDCIPGRVKGIHFVNAASFVHFTLNVIRRTLSSKLRNRIHLHHGDLESLYAFIPRENLPQSLGGELGQTDYEEAVQELIERNHVIEKLRTYTFCGNVRPLPRDSTS